MLIHLLNMLIAIMGETFQVRSTVAESIRVKDHLSFVVDNWHLSDYVLKEERKKIRYIVTAMSSTEDQFDESSKLIERVENLESKLDDRFDKLNQTLVRTQLLVKQIQFT